jgi:LPXTG-site transpeptidase (sortase) family protein
MQLKRLLLKYAQHIQYGLILAAVAVGSFGLGLSVGQGKSNQAAANHAANLVDQANKNRNHTVPATLAPKPESVSAYTVAPDKPRYLDIPRLGVHARVLDLGLTTGGAVATPGNIYDAGWYSGSAGPGQPGAMLIDGHVSSWTTHGVFYNLGSLRPGDSMKIERGDGTIFTYSVVRTQVYPADKVDMAAALKPAAGSGQGLNLITCTGSVIPGTNDFDKREVVFAVLSE